MANLGDIARITPLNKSIASELPDVDDPEALKVAAELVHKLLRTKITAVSIVRTMDGRPGREWQGRILSEVIYRIWPRMIDKVLVTPEEARVRSGVLLDYMIRCGIIRCIRKTYEDVPAKWWVSDNFTPMTVTVTPVEAETVEDEVSEEADQVEAEATEGEGTLLVCREPDCGAEFKRGMGRSGHEYNVHNMVANAAGERFYYTADDFTSQYVVNEIMSALKAAPKPLTFYGICAVTYDKDPRLGKPIVRDHLGGLVAVEAVIKSERGPYTYYEAAQGDVLTGPMKGLLDAVAEAKQAKAEAKATALAEATATAHAPVPVDLKSGIEYVRHTASTSLGTLKSVLEAIELLTVHAAEKDREIAGLRQRLMAAPKTSSREAELEAELVKVMTERDIYKGKVEAFESALRGLRTM